MEPVGDRDTTARAGTLLSSAYASPVAEELFLGHRRMLLALAYRLLGQVTEAEDVVQDAWLRWSAADRGEVANPAAFLTTVTTRLALDRLRSAAARREVYVGPWLPEPLPTGDEAFSEFADPAEGLALRETASMGMLLLLDRLSPAERAVFVLREAFGLPYAEIAAVLERTEDYDDAPTPEPALPRPFRCRSGPYLPGPTEWRMRRRVLGWPVFGRDVDSRAGFHPTEGGSA